ncbi:MAG: glycosyltransferase family 39 protein, partial [Caldilineaceae bacterium]|nr:glycosyltransferase family 39 protein [Caldilineaceae bacterium]
MVRRYWPEALILLVAALVRCWRLDYHSFWFDETVSLDWAEDGPGYIWQSTFTLLKDKHPPGYYLLLHAWQNMLEVFGLQHNDVALRTLGALLGVLTVLGLLLLVRRVSGRATGLLAATLAALAPVLVWYSQELRMFQPATTGLVWAAYCLLRGWQGATRLSRVGWWLGMVAAFTFALYSYLFSALLLPAAGLTLVGLWAAARLEITRTKKLLHSPNLQSPNLQSPNLQSPNLQSPN